MATDCVLSGTCLSWPARHWGPGEQLPDCNCPHYSVQERSVCVMHPQPAALIQQASRQLQVFTPPPTQQLWWKIRSAMFCIFKGGISFGGSCLLVVNPCMPSSAPLTTHFCQPSLTIPDNLGCIIILMASPVYCTPKWPHHQDQDTWVKKVVIKIATVTAQTTDHGNPKKCQLLYGRGCDSYSDLPVPTSHPPRGHYAHAG